MQQQVEQLQHEGNNFLHAQQERLSGYLRKWENALRGASERFREDQEQESAHFASSIADRVHSASSFVDETSPRDMGHRLQEVAQRNPGAVVGGLFLAGVALGRFLKSSEGSDEDQKQLGEPVDPLEQEEDAFASTPQFEMHANSERGG